MPQVSKVGCSQAGCHVATSRQVTETWLSMSCRVRLDIYLVGYGGERREGKKSRSKGRSGENGERHSCLFRGETEKGEIRLQAGRKICLPQWTGEGVGVACLLKRQDRSLQ